MTTLLPPHPPSNQLLFTKALLAWFDIHGRKHLPWQNPRTPYTVWVSEVMLQQTQVKTVIPYFLKFLTAFPTVSALAEATEDEVLSHWAGLGYYSRGRNLHKAAQSIMARFNGDFPACADTLKTLPGIGDSTAAAIVSLAFNQPAAILDGNVKRILSRYYLIDGAPTQASTQKKLLAKANASLSDTRAADYTQAIMDLGALICTPKNPQCRSCPIHTHCLAYKHQCIDAYPEKKPKKTLPIKKAQFVLLHHTHHKTVYLEKQPAPGLWGGLWSLPSLDINDCAIAYTEKTHALNAEYCGPQPMIKHTFTHFKLELYPTVLHTHHTFPTSRGLSAGSMDAADKPRHVGDELNRKHTLKTGRWVKLTDLTTLGLPKPIQTIVKHFLSTNAAHFF